MSSCRCLAAAAAVLVALQPFSAAVAEPITLKLSFYGSTNDDTFRAGIKPFVDAINSEGQGRLVIDVYANGTLAASQAAQPQLVLDDGADLALLIPGITPYRFPDNEVLAQPGLFHDAAQGTRAYTRLVETHALRGYADYVTIGAYAPGPNVIHSRKPIYSLANLDGQKIRGSNPIEAAALARLGAVPTVLEMPKVANAIANGAIDGTTLSTTGLFEFGILRAATYHYLLRISIAPLALVMNRKKFDSLPEDDKALIRRYSGNWTAAAWIRSYGRTEQSLLNRLRSDPRQTVVAPSVADLATAQRIYRSMIDAWAAADPRHRQLVAEVESDLTAHQRADEAGYGLAR